MPTSDAQSVVRFEHVTVSFDGVPALDDVSFEVSQGETRIILGAASSGKTVLLKTALGLVRPDSGAVYLFGQDITHMTERELFDIRSKVGMLFQESALFDSLTIKENVAYPLLNQKSIQCPPEDVDKRVKDALHFVELDQTLARFPSELSGGMRRRAAIARAVVTEPPLVLYDSPTAGLDPITAYTIMALVIKERDVANTTTLIVTHRFQDGLLTANFRYNPESGQLVPVHENGNQTQHLTKFIVMREAKIVFLGTEAELETVTDPYISKFRRQGGG